jgi:biopolymer transport protein ExbD
MQGNTQDDNYYIQLNDKVVAMQADQNTTTSLEAIGQFIDAERQRMSSEDLTRMTVSIKADRDVPMGIIADIKKTLQNSYALKINYSATEK